MTDLALAPRAGEEPAAVAPGRGGPLGPPSPAARPAALTPPGPLGVAAGSAAVFLVVLAFLALQVRAGKDPAIGAGPAETTRPQRVLVKRIVRRRVVVRRRAPGGSAPAVPAAVASNRGSPAPPAAAPPPVAPPAAAPAPAPVVSRAS